MSSPPDWTAIFTLHPELDPPGYAETVIFIHEHPYSERKKKKEKKSSNKK